jgi:4-hydroxy-tetrahydrodipicolinate synthase
MVGKSAWEGVFVFPVTPMDATGETLNLESLATHLDSLVESGVHGVVPLGSTGEFAYLDATERREVVRTSVEAVAGRTKVIAGASAITTRDAVAHARVAEELGADAVLILLQSYFPLTDDAIVDHLRAISEAIDIPVFIYNNPHSSNHDISTDLFARLAELPSIAGLKDSTGGLDRLMEVERALGDRFVIHCGWEHLALPMFSLGVRGWSTATANLVPRQCVAMYSLAVEHGDIGGALAIHERISPLAKFLLSVPLAPAVKEGLAYLGRDVGAPRPPLTALEPDQRRTLIGLLDEARADAPAAVGS